MRRNTGDYQYLCKFTECINIEGKCYFLMRDTKKFWNRKLSDEEMKMDMEGKYYW